MSDRIASRLTGALIFLTAGYFATSLASAQQGNTTVQLPTFGVAVDADGVLSVKVFEDPDGRLRAARIAAAQASLPADVQRSSPLRKVSLVRLQRHVKRLLDAGQPLDEAARYVAGLQRLRYVFVFPDANDLVIAGPAEGWMPDASGRVVGLRSGLPVLQLEDLAVALRAYPPGSQDRPFVGCTIEPDRDGLARLQQFQQTIPKFIPQQARQTVAVQVAQGTRDALGMAHVRVFGVPADSHFAAVMVEADYRMKRIGVGLEPPPLRMTTFLDALTVPQHAVLQRWWFVPDYDCVRVTADRLGMELVGDGVQLLGEDKLIGPDGELAPAGAKANRASELFTTAFTRKYAEIARNSPVYAQLRNLVDLLVGAAYLRQQDVYGRIGWTMEALGEEGVLSVQTSPTPRLVPCAVHCVWKGNRLFSPAGGGVSIRPDEALAAQRLLADDEGQVTEARRQAMEGKQDESWWWD